MDTRIRGWIVIAVGLASVMLFSALQAFGGERSYLVSHSPEIRVLRAEISGGDRMETIRYDLLGDGTLTGFAISAYASYTPQLIFSAHLGLDDYDAIVADLVDSGLMEFDVHSMEDAFKQAPLPHHERMVRVTIRLEGYEDALLDPSAGVEREIGIYAARLRAEQFPDVPPLATIGRLLTRLSKIELAHRTRPR